MSPPYRVAHATPISTFICHMSPSCTMYAVHLTQYIYIAKPFYFQVKSFARNTALVTGSGTKRPKRGKQINFTGLAKK